MTSDVEPGSGCAAVRNANGYGRTPVTDSDGRWLEIALVNNMPDTALRATERQFTALLQEAAQGLAIRLRLFALAGVPRGEVGQKHVSHYCPINKLWDRPLDGLIVTGTEPRLSNLSEEPYWSSLTQLIEWAERYTTSTIWSCLAAHGAVLYLDGITRQPLVTKRFGVFEADRLDEHPLLNSAPRRVLMPHSRWNDLPEPALRACGYRVLTRSQAGVDVFVKKRKSLFVFLQGHPEYEADTLLLEYRRDVGRFLRGERETYPPMPEGYFDCKSAACLEQIEMRGRADRREELLNDIPTARLAGVVVNTWRTAAVSMYRRWLLELSPQKTGQSHVCLDEADGVTELYAR
jgi:homoserine O-succinyltransferase